MPARDRFWDQLNMKFWIIEQQGIALGFYHGLVVLGQAFLGFVLYLCLHNFKQVETKILSRLSKTTFTWLSKRLVVGQSAHWIQNFVQFASDFYTSGI